MVALGLEDLRTPTSATLPTPRTTTTQAHSMRLARALTTLAALSISSLIAAAQEPLSATAGPPVRRIESALAVSTEQITAITSVRQLSDGRVMVNDGSRRRLIIMDSTLKHVTVVLDSMTDVENSYGIRPGALIAYLGDSTLFVDPASYSILVIDAAGKIARVKSVPRVQDVSYYTTSPASGAGVPGIDAHGRLVYRRAAATRMPAVPPPSNIPYIPEEPDSALIVRIGLSSRTLDTAGYVRIAKFIQTVSISSSGSLMFSGYENPMPVVDDWAVLSDGTIAFARGRDYRVEYLNPDGTRTSSAKLPFDWQRITDDDKTRWVDSAKAVQQKSADNNFARSVISWVNTYGQAYPPDFKVPNGYVVPAGLSVGWVLPPGVTVPATYIATCPVYDLPKTLHSAANAVIPAPVARDGGPPNATAPAARPTPPPSTPPAVAAGVGAAAGVAASGGRGGAPPSGPGTPQPAPPGTVPLGGQASASMPCAPSMARPASSIPPFPTYRPPTVPPASMLPDYKPPFGTNAVRADADGNLWIRTIPMKPVSGGPIYDVVNRQGQLVDRLQIPTGHNLVGFGTGRVVYLSTRDATGLHLERIKLK
jgi:hypothetical protein